MVIRYICAVILSGCGMWLDDRVRERVREIDTERRVREDEGEIVFVS